MGHSDLLARLGCAGCLRGAAGGGRCHVSACKAATGVSGVDNLLQRSASGSVLAQR